MPFVISSLITHHRLSSRNIIIIQKFLLLLLLIILLATSIFVSISSSSSSFFVGAASSPNNNNISRTSAPTEYFHFDNTTVYPFIIDQTSHRNIAPTNIVVFLGVVAPYSRIIIRNMQVHTLRFSAVLMQGVTISFNNVTAHVNGIHMNSIDYEKEGYCDKYATIDSWLNNNNNPNSFVHSEYFQQKVLEDDGTLTLQKARSINIAFSECNVFIPNLNNRPVAADPGLEVIRGILLTTPFICRLRPSTTNTSLMTGTDTFSKNIQLMTSLRQNETQINLAIQNNKIYFERIFEPKAPLVGISVIPSFVDVDASKIEHSASRFYSIDISDNAVVIETPIGLDKEVWTPRLVALYGIEIGMMYEIATKSYHENKQSLFFDSYLDSLTRQQQTESTTSPELLHLPPSINIKNNIFNLNGFMRNYGIQIGRFGILSDITRQHLNSVFENSDKARASGYHHITDQKMILPINVINNTILMNGTGEGIGMNLQMEFPLFPFLRVKRNFINVTMIASKYGFSHGEIDPWGHGRLWGVHYAADYEQYPRVLIDDNTIHLFHHQPEDTEIHVQVRLSSINHGNAPTSQSVTISKNIFSVYHRVPKGSGIQFSYIFSHTLSYFYWQRWLVDPTEKKTVLLPSVTPDTPLQFQSHGPWSIVENKVVEINSTQRVRFVYVNYFKSVMKTNSPLPALNISHNSINVVESSDSYISFL